MSDVKSVREAQLEAQLKTLQNRYSEAVLRLVIMESALVEGIQDISELARAHLQDVLMKAFERVAQVGTAEEAEVAKDAER